MIYVVFKFYFDCFDFINIIQLCLLLGVKMLKMNDIAKYIVFLKGKTKLWTTI